MAATMSRLRVERESIALLDVIAARHGVYPPPVRHPVRQLLRRATGYAAPTALLIALAWLTLALRPDLVEAQAPAPLTTPEPVAVSALPS